MADRLKELFNSQFNPNQYPVEEDINAVWSWAGSPPALKSPVIPSTIGGQSPESTPPANNQGALFNAPSPSPTTTPTPVSGGGEDLYAKYRDPKTGEVMSPEEYSIYLGSKVPKGTGQIPNYAGDAMTNPNESAEDLTTRARNMSNARNDMAVGETDPYKVGNKSGIAYSPQELKAIENAYAGIYDPALNDVFARLSKKQEEDATEARQKEITFKTNESIRQWKETTGSKVSGSSSSSSSSSTQGGDDKNLFTQTQLNKGASQAGMTIPEFETLDDDLKNFYVNMPKGTNYEGDEERMDLALRSWINAVRNGEKDANEVREMITSSSLTPAVKALFLNELNALIDEDVPEEEQEKWLSRALGWIKDKAIGLID